MQRAERTVRIDLEQLKQNVDFQKKDLFFLKTRNKKSYFFFKHNKFRNLIIQSIYSTPGVSQPSEEDITDEAISNEWKKIVSERTGLIENVNSLKKKLTSSEQLNSELGENITQFEYHISQIEQKLTTSGRRTALLENELKTLKEIQLNEKLHRLRNLMTEIYKNELDWQMEIEETLKKSFEIDLNNNDCNFFKLILIRPLTKQLSRVKIEPMYF